MTAPDMDLALDLDLSLDLDVDGLTGAAPSTGAGAEKPTLPPRETQSRWSSTSSVESDVDKFWVCYL